MSKKRKNSPAPCETKTPTACPPKPVEEIITKEKKAPQKIIAEEKMPPAERPVPGRGIQREYLDGKKSCRVTFRLPGSAAPNGRKVFIVGDFNDWNIHANQMKKQQNGDHVISLSLVPGREYQFRYLIDDSIWENDWKADKYVKSPYGNYDNSVVII